MPALRSFCPFAAAVVAALTLPALASAAEFYVGEPVEQDNLQIVPNYLTGKHGFADDAWIPYLTIHFKLAKQGSNFTKTGTLAAMTADDGPHYANNVRMAGPGTYDLTYEILPPSSNGFIRHIDKATGVPDWWKPITAHWTFTYPSKEKS